MNLDTVKNKKILLFGKSRAFSEEEFLEQIKVHNIELTKEYDEDVSFVVEGRMMTPYEQNSSDLLYEERALQSISIDLLEKLLVEEIDADVLLMSLKLSHDKERLKSFIQNSMIDDALFFRLVQLYKWQGEDFFENDDNRDVSAAFIARFYENIERNHNVQYATTGFIHLVAQAKTSKLLEAIYELEPLKFHEKIKKAIAMSPFIDAKLQKRLLRSNDAEILEALSHNKNLDKEILESLMQDSRFVQNIAKYVKLNDALFAELLPFAKELAENESLTSMMQESLLSLQNDTVDKALAQNSTLTQESINRLLLQKAEQIDTLLYANSAMPQIYLQEVYEKGHFFASLAQNENTPIEILYQLQLDSRYERAVKTNAGFGKHIQSENIGWLV